MSVVQVISWILTLKWLEKCWTLKLNTICVSRMLSCGPCAYSCSHVMLFWLQPSCQLHIMDYLYYPMNNHTLCLSQLRFRYEPEHENAARLHVGECCKQVLTGLKYYARIQAIVDHYRIVKGVKMCDKMAGQKYLTRAEYHARRPIWCYEATWNAMIDEWCNPDWIRKSETNRANRYTTRFKPHKGGSNSIAMICQKLVSY